MFKRSCPEFRKRLLIKESYKGYRKKVCLRKTHYNFKRGRLWVFFRIQNIFFYSGRSGKFLLRNIFLSHKVHSEFFFSAHVRDRKVFSIKFADRIFSPNSSPPTKKNPPAPIPFKLTGRSLKRY